MKVTSIPVEAIAIEPEGALDRILVFWINGLAPSGVVDYGYVTIVCYGAGWAAYFGAMGGRTIQEFFRQADTDYLVTKMGIGPHLKQRKRDDAYLGRIIDAVKRAITVEVVQ